MSHFQAKNSNFAEDKPASMSQITADTIFRTAVSVGLPPHPIAVGDRNIFLGSCFAEHIGNRFAEARLLTTVNPLGVLYNPMSIVRLLSTPRSADDDFVRQGGMWHSWLGDSSLSRLSADECRAATDEALALLHEALAHADNLFLTLGTSRYYTFRQRFQLVANCHRVPQSEFDEHELSTEEIVTSLDSVLSRLHGSNPRLQVVMTVSPYRYQKYGFHESQLSKARLLLAVDALQRLHPEWITYFPAYEIVLDELRDYRFYAEDMLHPSAQAVDYIWSRLRDEWMSDEARAYLARWQPIGRSLQHRPLHPESPDYAAFEQSLSDRLAQLQRDYPQLPIVDIF